MFDSNRQPDSTPPHSTGLPRLRGGIEPSFAAALRNEAGQEGFEDPARNALLANADTAMGFETVGGHPVVCVRYHAERSALRVFGITESLNPHGRTDSAIFARRTGVTLLEEFPEFRTVHIARLGAGWTVECAGDNASHGRKMRSDGGDLRQAMVQPDGQVTDGPEFAGPVSTIDLGGPYSDVPFTVPNFEGMPNREVVARLLENAEIRVRAALLRAGILQAGSALVGYESVEPATDGSFSLEVVGIPDDATARRVQIAAMAEVPGFFYSVRYPTATFNNTSWSVQMSAPAVDSEQERPLPDRLGLFRGFRELEVGCAAPLLREMEQGGPNSPLERVRETLRLVGIIPPVIDPKPLSIGSQYSFCVISRDPDKQGIIAMTADSTPDDAATTLLARIVRYCTNSDPVGC